ncbi:M1 family aminopeptidase [Pedobacter sp. MC2016-24]|uniref:M1 family metallopeptidase n=1 Tax=Pedobacter sp. MC2016-24 TaxID=2780090 RepID=UPI001880E498|nr:M1 family aminopeptidase [Pedobacter sp. MC2016-24]MBE9601815.1 aminopeptidase [Pedobacter sp. MC2016-24]
MVNYRILSLLFLGVLMSCSTLKQQSDPGLEDGVSRELALYRKNVLSDIHYHLDFDIPKERAQPIPTKESIHFKLRENKYGLQLDFRDQSDKLKKLSVNGVVCALKYDKEHILIAAENLKKGTNEIEIEFLAGEGALNRNADYLYTLFVPDRARTVFPCFDQPDLKAVYTLTLKVPANWAAMANAALVDSSMVSDRKTYRFKTSDTLSTYLFSFVAGRFDRVNAKVGKWNADFLYRETDTAKIRQSVAEVFKIHSNSLKYFEDWTSIPYPFQKFGFAAIPDFQFGGMEHVGAIQYKASSLFLDGGATKDQLNSRTNLIAHETAHMWFGDLVTMSWFTDVWMKEVFANFMADKSTERGGNPADFDQKFLIDHFPAAYAVDRSTGANPIRQDLANLKDAGTMYGNIIYHKAPIMMRQLERLMGKEKFQQGVREYLKKFANSNASWPDLIAVLDKYADADLQQWNKVWVNENGRPVIDYTLGKKDGKIKNFSITQQAEYGKERVWPQYVELALYYPDHVKELTVNLNAAKVEVKELLDQEVPLYILFNSTGQGYGLWPVDSAMFDKIYSITKPLNRASAYISLYENMLNGRSIKPLDLLKLFMEGTAQEKDELNLKLITNYIGSIYWAFISKDERLAINPVLEDNLWKAIQLQDLPNPKKMLFKAYQDVFLSKDAYAKLNDIWKSQKALPGLKLFEDDYTALAFALALRDDQDSGILKAQLNRITNADRKKRFEFIMPAVSADLKDRDAFFQRLSLRANREKEANVGTALYYLHHPLRQSGSVKYLGSSLEMLEEIQTTGDIFFPQNWLQSILSLYQSQEAAGIVQTFLKANPAYNPKLKAKILQAADPLFRARKLLDN